MTDEKFQEKTDKAENFEFGRSKSQSLRSGLFLIIPAGVETSESKTTGKCSAQQYTCLQTFGKQFLQVTP